MARTDKASRNAGIEVKGLVRRFKDVEAVSGIDLTISPGEIYGFLGPNVARSLHRKRRSLGSPSA
jgi:ABC-type uncharacterized transport system ATPase subunit